MSTGRVHRATATVLASLTAVFGVALASPAAAQPTPPQTEDPAGAAAGWLARQLVDGERFEVEFGGVVYPDQGMTADAVLAFDAADVAQDHAVRATTWLSRPDILAGYIGDGTADSYPGALAKVALVALAQGQDPTSFGGVDLVGRLLARQADTGRFRDLSSYPPPPAEPSDYSNALSQSLAVIALRRSAGGVSDSVAAGATYLAAARCADGGFPLQFEQPVCTSQVDATGFAVQALLAAGQEATAAAGLDYLESVQLASGGFQDAGVANANSTALAAQALRVGGRDAAATAATAFLSSLQVRCDGPAGSRGEVRYDQAGTGDPARATAQAVLGLAGVGLVDLDHAGDAAAAPELACQLTPTSQPTSSSAQPTPSSSPAGSTSTVATSTASAPATSAPGGGSGNLPTTGVSLWPALTVGALLVLAGAALVLLASQRRDPA